MCQNINSKVGWGGGRDEILVKEDNVPPISLPLPSPPLKWSFEFCTKIVWCVLLQEIFR